jgi:hypothetical protein
MLSKHGTGHFSIILAIRAYTGIAKPTRSTPPQADFGGRASPETGTTTGILRLVPEILNF